MESINTYLYKASKDVLDNMGTMVQDKRDYNIYNISGKFTDYKIKVEQASHDKAITGTRVRYHKITRLDIFDTKDKTKCKQFFGNKLPTELQDGVKKQWKNKEKMEKRLRDNREKEEKRKREQETREFMSKIYDN